MKRIHVSIISILVLLFLLQAPVVVPAQAEEITNGSLSEQIAESTTLTVRLVSESSGRVIEETTSVYSMEELIERSFREYDYTFVDSDKGVIIDHAMGVSLRDLLSEEGVDLEAIGELIFLSDETRLELSVSDLLDADRYCYFSLPDHYEDGSYRFDPSVALFCQKVESILAVRDNWMPVTEGGMFWSNPEEMTDENGIRLLFGQASITEQKAEAALCRIHTIVVKLQEKELNSSDIVSAGDIKVQFSDDQESTEQIDQQTDGPSKIDNNLRQESKETINILDADETKKVQSPDRMVILEPIRQLTFHGEQIISQEPLNNNIVTQAVSQKLLGRSIFQIQSQSSSPLEDLSLSKSTTEPVSIAVDDEYSNSNAVLEEKISSGNTVSSPEDETSSGEETDADTHSRTTEKNCMN